MPARTDQGPRPTLRQDYQPPAWLVDHVELDLVLDREETTVRAELDVRRNPESRDPRAPLKLDGEGLHTRMVAVDGRPLDKHQYRLDGQSMVIGQLPERARISTQVAIHPSRNTALEGLYASGSSLLTQCEAEGFRKITWFPDRPDIMATYRVRMEADQDIFPVLLSNGNLVDEGQLEDNRYFATWEDPFPKPSYLFALVAGKLEAITDTFTTCSGRAVQLKIYSEPENIDRLDHAMASLKRAMAWDEERFGLEYDLDIYHIIATHDFNMGAMENKSLNIFNARYVLADQDTATDADFEAIEAVIGHEYFHNWTGNRVTCRDWFQLTLKEGLTVFRDQEFTSDLRSRPVKRISDVAALMSRQFPEDAGPMAHSVRPERYIEINNFYTATVYEKGAEVVRMYQTLLGRDGFRRGLDLYFQRHDGQAVTCDDFLAALADANNRDLRQFERWYRQVGTPRLQVTANYDHRHHHLVLKFRQSLPEHADNHQIGPLMIPIKIGFLDRDNQSLPVTLADEDQPGDKTRLLVLTKSEAEYRFRDLPPDALPSLLRDFSAPVNLDFDWSTQDLARLAGHDPDAFNRWRACRRLAEQVLEDAIASGGDLPVSAGLLEQAWAAILDDAELDPALAAELLALPSENELVQQRDPVDIDAVHRARKRLLESLCDGLRERLESAWKRCRDEEPWSEDGKATARRRLKNLALSYWCNGQHNAGLAQARKQFADADNMTDRLAGLRCLLDAGGEYRSGALEAFEARHGGDALVMDKWFAVQAGVAETETVDTVATLMNHPAFSLKNPNKVRALLGAFSHNNPLAFHRADGAGYRLLGQAVRDLDALNPQVAARLATAFNRWHTVDAERAKQMRAELEQIRAVKSLSPDVGEIVAAALRGR